MRVRNLLQGLNSNSRAIILYNLLQREAISYAENASYPVSLGTSQYFEFI